MNAISFKTTEYIPLVENSSPAPVDQDSWHEKMTKFHAFLSHLHATHHQTSLHTLINQCKANPDNSLKYLSEIRQLDLSHCELETLPEEVSLLTNLEILRLINNKLSTLPLSLASLQKLRRVELEMNQFQEVPETICQLAIEKIAQKKIFELYLRDNPMTSVPAQIRPVIRSMPNFRAIYKK